MAKGYIDSASIHGALAVLKLGKKDSLVSAWDRHCLLVTTYLLLFRDMCVIPGPGGYRGASGLYSNLLSALPALERRELNHRTALRSTKNWLNKKGNELRQAWQALQAADEFSTWASMSREYFWLDHMRMHESLFNTEFIPYLAPILNTSEKDLKKIHLSSQNETDVKRWIKSDLAGEDAQLANGAYLLSALIRGRFHEYLASSNSVHHCGHPLRQFVKRKLGRAQSEPVYNSEELFVKILVGSALLETSEKRRVSAWAQNICIARKHIHDYSTVVLPSTPLLDDAERMAAEAARKCGISTTNKRTRLAIDWGTALGIGSLVSTTLSSWHPAPVSAVIPRVYNYVTASSIGEDVSKALLDTKKRFLRLAGRVPGRIECSLER